MLRPRGGLSPSVPARGYPRARRRSGRQAWRVEVNEGGWARPKGNGATEHEKRAPPRASRLRRDRRASLFEPPPQPLREPGPHHELISLGALLEHFAVF